MQLSVVVCKGVKTVSKRPEALRGLMLCFGGNLAKTFLERGRGCIFCSKKKEKKKPEVKIIQKRKEKTEGYILTLL